MKCPITNRPILTNSRGRNLGRYCVVSGNGLENQYFPSFHKFCIFAGITDPINTRTKHFQTQHVANINGYRVEMFYNCERDLYEAK